MKNFDSYYSSMMIRLIGTFSLPISQNSNCTNCSKYGVFWFKITAFQALSNIKLKVSFNSLCMQVNFIFFSFFFTEAVRTSFYGQDCCSLENEIRNTPVYFFHFVELLASTREFGLEYCHED